MIELSNYKKRKIAHYYLDTQDTGKTINKFNISYKQLYKIIDKSKITSFKIINGKRYKICSSCKNQLLYTEEYFYKRKGTDYLYSNCKTCMKLLSKSYKIINKEKLSKYNRKKSKEYYYKNKEKIIKNKRIYYYRNRNRILNNKRLSYIKTKIEFIKGLKIFIK